LPAVTQNVILAQKLRCTLQAAEPTVAYELI
jgi:hypothetical protein